MKKIVYYIGILVCTNILLFSCIKEDMSDCPPDGFSPKIVLVPYNGNTIDNNDLYSGKVYVLDELTGSVIDSYEIPGRPKLQTTYTPKWGLPVGRYTYVAWLNTDAQYFSVDERQLLLKFLVPKTQIVDKTDLIPFLCYGNIENAPLDSISDNLITIPVMQFTNKINLTVTGLKNVSPQGDEYTFSINDNNGNYGFDGDFASCPAFTYSTTKRSSADVFNASLTVLKLSGSRPNPTLTIKNNATGDEYSIGLIPLILSKIPTNDFDKTHIYNITISNPFTREEEITITVTVNDWVDNQSNPDLNIN